MSEPIKVGDLVQVVRGMPCCGKITQLMGTVFKVSALVDNEGTTCITCGAIVKRIDPISVRGHPQFAFQLSRLKRIPPLSELEGERTEETLLLPTKEPA